MHTVSVRAGTTADWADGAPILHAGELGVDTTAQVIKIGDGVTAFADLDTAVGAGGGGGSPGPLRVVTVGVEFSYDGDDLYATVPGGPGGFVTVQDPGSFYLVLLDSVDGVEYAAAGAAALAQLFRVTANDESSYTTDQVPVGAVYYSQQTERDDSVIPGLQGILAGAGLTADALGYGLLVVQAGAVTVTEV